MKSSTFCPLCNNAIILKDIGTACRDPELAYMDGWHHKQCLDDYMYGPEEQLPPEPE